MADVRFCQELAACHAAGITIESLTNNNDARCCSDYGYATYYLATLASRVFMLVKPANWPHIGFGVVMANEVSYCHPNGGPLAANGTPQTDTLATQLRAMARLPKPLVSDPPARFMGAECDGLTITCVQTAQCAYMLVRWTPTATLFPRYQLVVVPTDWETRGFGLLSPMPRVMRDNNGATVMVRESIAITYRSGQLPSILDQHVADDRLSSFSE